MAIQQGHKLLTYRDGSADLLAPVMCGKGF